MVKFKRSLAVIMAAAILFWSAFPSVSLAFFITPGQAIQYGTPIKGGSPISGGQFMVPGDVYETGNALKDGQIGAGGQIIIPAPQTAVLGQFILPNVINSPKYDFLITGDAMTGGEASSNGDAVESGEAAKGGEGSTNGDAVQGGDASTNGDAAKSGDGGANGDPLNGGDSSTDGQSINGGEATNDGESSSGGDALTGGEAGSNGDGLNGGENGSNGETPSGGKAGEGGDSPTGGDSGKSGELTAGNGNGSPSALSLIFSSADTNRGLLGTVVGVTKDFKKYILGTGKTIMEGFSAYYAGFDFEKLKSGNYKVKGKSKLKNPILDYFYNNYKKYKIDGVDRYMPAGKSTQKPFKINSFFDSKKFSNFSSPSKFFSSTWNSVKSGLNDGYNVFSKKFWSGSNMAKLNGPVNIALSAFNSIYDYSPAGKKSSMGWNSSNFAADLTVDLAIGAGTTVLSSVASSMAAGAVAGSVVPGVGTIVGAVAGLATGFIVTGLINGTGPGRKAKQWVSGKLSEGYSWVADKAGSLFNGAKKMFGFGG